MYFYYSPQRNPTEKLSPLLSLETVLESIPNISFWKLMVKAFSWDAFVDNSKNLGKIPLPMKIKLGLELGLVLFRVRAENFRIRETLEIL